MRISTKTIYESGMSRMSELQASLVRTQQQIATGRRILTPSDDPVAAARALEVTQSQEINAQYGLNRQNVKSSLNQEEGILQSITSLLQDVKTLTVNAGNATLDDRQRSYIASDVSGRLQELIGLANSRDGLGNYFFSGFQTGTQPFTATAGGAQYHGDQGQRMLQVGAARQLAMSDTGDAVFQQIMSGNGVFTTAATPANTGTGVISVGTATGLGTIGAQYQVVFSGAGSTSSYSVFDITADPGMTSPPLQTGTYVSGQAISFNGVQVEITGAPAAGDTFTVAPSANQDMFKTIGDLISALNAPTAGNGRTTLSNALNTANLNLDNAIDHILTARASVGTRLKEIDTLDNAGEERNLQYETTLQDLQGLDYVKAITELTQSQTTLEAAQKSFAKISGLSLFNYI